MGIELPAELAEVAARAGVTWPQADEDKLRASAAAWRDAGAKLGTLAGESDGAAGRALSAMTGATGEAARRHWNSFTAPDGRLDDVLRGCTAAADRLDHAAQQVGAAKVELVRELVNLAKNTDAANQAATAGHPTALLGLDAVLKGATANVTHLTTTLTDAIRLDSGVQIGGPPPVNANPGVHAPGHGGLLDNLLGGGHHGGGDGGPGHGGQDSGGQGGGGQGGGAPGQSPGGRGPLGGLLGDVLGGGQDSGNQGGRGPDGQGVPGQGVPGQGAPGQGGGGLLGNLLGGGQQGGGLVGGLVDAVVQPVAGIVEPVLGTVGDVVDGAVGTVDRAVDTVADTVDRAVDTVDRTVQGAVDNLPGRGHEGGPGHGPGDGPGGNGPGNGPGPDRGPGLVSQVTAPLTGGGPVDVGPVAEPVVRAADTVTSSSAAVLDRPVLPVDAHAPAPQPAAPAANSPQAPGFGAPGGVSSGPVGGAAGGPVTGAPAAATSAGAAAQSQAGQQAAGQAQQAGGQRADQRGPALAKDGGQLPGQSGQGTSGQGQSGNQSGQGNQAQAKDAGQAAQAKDAAAPKDAAQPAKDAGAKSRDDAALGFAVLPLGSGGRDTLVRGGPGVPPGAVPGQGFPDAGTVSGGRGFASGAGFGPLSGVLGSGVLDSGKGSAVVPTEVVASRRAGQDAEPSDESVALFLTHMFAGGALPPAQSAPARQLPAPPEDQDFAPGLRFEPQGHPDGHLVDASARVRPRSVPGPGAVPDAALTEGYDPQAGMHERDWDRRFLVRLDPPEYAWPPAELFPEGGYEAGQPGVLAAGVELDRFGGPEGRVLSEAGTPFTSRSLPPAALDAGYRRYRVARELPVWFTLSAEWFGQEGGGVRYRTTYPVAELVALGYLEEIR